SWTTQALAVASLLLLVGLVWRSARVLTPHAPLSLANSILLTAGCQLPATHLPLDSVDPLRFLLFGLVPVAGYLLACGVMLWGQSRRDRLDGPTGLAVLLFLGVAAFSLLVVLGFTVSRYGDVAEALGLLALPLALAGLPALVGGALVHRGLTDD